jgi:hypothetical protein
MDENNFASLTKVPKGPTLTGMVRAAREDRLSERMPIMKTLLRARQAAPKKNDSILPSHSRRHGASETGAWQEQHGNGRALRHIDRAAVAQVYGGGCEQQSRYGDAHAVLRDGSARAGYGNVRPDPESDARGRSDDRAGQRVTAGGAFATAIPNTLPQSADPFDLVPSAWRNGRPSKSAATVTPDLFELAGIRAAEHWLKVRPTVRPNQWCRSTFDNLVAGLGRIPSYADCLAAFERSFKRRIVAATRTDRDATEVRHA